MAYSISSYDVCTQGNERLRNRNEFILAVPIYASTLIGELIADLKDDVQACMRPDHFDYDACDALLDGLRDTLAPTFAHPNPFDLEARSESSDEDYGTWEPCYFYLYVADDSHEYSVWGD